MYFPGFQLPRIRFFWVWGAPLLYLMTAAILGTVIAYLIYPFSQALGFGTLATRSAQLVMILGTLPLIVFFHLRSKEMGIESGMGFRLISGVCKGFGQGLLILGPVLVFQFAVGLRHWVAGWEDMFQVAAAKMPGILVTAACVAVLEEWLFRGVFLGFLLRYVSVLPGVVVSAFYFAGLHFLRGEWPEGFPITLMEGLAGSVVAFSQWFARVEWDVMFALVAAGVLLGTIRWRFGCLGRCIGIHASWIVAIKTTRLISDLKAGNPWLFLIGEFDGINGIGTAVWLMICTGVLLVWNLRS